MSDCPVPLTLLPAKVQPYNADDIVQVQPYRRGLTLLTAVLLGTCAERCGLLQESEKVKNEVL